LLRTGLSTPVAIARLTTLLEDRLAPRETRHAVLLDILGLGVLLTGESGIGKSECALDLVVRGHRLVADDTVEIRCRGESILIGRSPEFTRHHVEIRGLGILNIADLFGVSATRPSKRVELIVHLERWDSSREYERLGVDTATAEILGVRIPLVTMPVTSGRNVAMLVEVAARNQLLRSRGRDAARLLVDRLERRLARLGETDATLDPEDL
jgi:HPr kinase/phosphorylase